MSGINKWVPFFEETSQRRDTASWWEHLKSKVLPLGFEVKGLVSDRARALVKLSKAGYLNVNSMPDLFHFAQDMGKAVGCRIGLKKRQLEKKWSDCADDWQQAELKKELNQVSQYQQGYRQQIEQINKTVHPFNGRDEWQQKEEVEKGLLQCFTKIGNIAKALKMNIALPKASKILNQIPDIAKGVQAWVESTSKEIEQWSRLNTIPILHQQWFEKCALPYAYWQLQLRKTQAKARDADLRAYYRQRADNAQRRYQQHHLKLEENTRQQYLDKAFALAATFQRSSSQVEGRNGYLAFAHHGHKGIPNRRLKVLTVVHNFDVRREDGSTPAQRLFQRSFPDLFEFLCQNVTGFKEPRRRKHKSLILNTVQR